MSATARLWAMPQSNQPRPNPWTIPRIWQGKTAILVAGGPSLTREDASHRLGDPGIVHLAINDAYRLIPEAALLYACDLRWWNWHHADVCRAFRGMKTTTDKKAALKYGNLHWIEGRHQPGLCREPNAIHYGDNSGYQAINLAWQLGARRMILLGYDLKRGPGGETHWFGNHPDPIVSNYAKWIGLFRPLAADLKREDCEVINCSPDSALDAFPKMTLAEALR
jgi:hypothetical protein